MAAATVRGADLDPWAGMQLGLDSGGSRSGSRCLRWCVPVRAWRRGKATSLADREADQLFGACAPAAAFSFCLS